MVQAVIRKLKTQHFPFLLNLKWTKHWAQFCCDAATGNIFTTGNSDSCSILTKQDSVSCSSNHQTIMLYPVSELPSNEKSPSCTSLTCSTLQKVCDVTKSTSLTPLPGFWQQNLVFVLFKACERSYQASVFAGRRPCSVASCKQRVKNAQCTVFWRCAEPFWMISK